MKSFSKILFLFATIFVYNDGLAQSIEQKKNIFAKVDSLIMNYNKAAGMVARGQSIVSEKSISKFNELFTPTAKMDDEMILQWFEGNFANPFGIVNKSAKDYGKDVAKYYPQGFKVKVHNMAINLKKMPETIEVMMDRTITGSSNNGLSLEVNDTVKISLNVSADFNNVLIAEIAIQGKGKRVFINDKDEDFIPDDKDKCPTLPGYFGADGCPTDAEKENAKKKQVEVKDKEKIEAAAKDALAKQLKDNAKAEKEADKTKEAQAKLAAEQKKNQQQSQNQSSNSTTSNQNTNNLKERLSNLLVPKESNKLFVNLNFVGGSFNPGFSPNKFNLYNKSISSLYTNIINSNNDTAKTHFDNGKTFGANLQFEYYLFGDKVNVGISSGISFMQQSFDLTLDSFHVEFKNVDNKDNDFRQLISAPKITENSKAKNLSIPICLAIKSNFESKIGFSINAGFLLNIGYTYNVTTDAKFDYEAIYKFSDDGKKTIFDEAQNPSKNDWLITKKHYDKSKPNDAKDFNEYYSTEIFKVGLNKEIETKKQTVETHKKTSIGFLVQPNITYSISDKISVYLGGYLITQNFKNDDAETNNYYLTKEIGDYKSMLKSYSGEYTTKTFGINVGLRYAIF